jgi:hypothetical protein
MTYTAVATFQSEPEWLVRIEMPGFASKEDADRFLELCQIDVVDDKLLLTSAEGSRTFEHVQHQSIKSRVARAPLAGCIVTQDEADAQIVGGYYLYSGLDASFLKLSTDAYRR